MATTYATVEVMVVVDAAGDYGVGRDHEEASTSYTDNIQPLEDAEGTRRVLIKVRVPLPTPIELTGEVTCDEAEAGLTVAG